MNVFTIRDIENLCRIKAHTLRIWEQRYKLISPKRKASNHRYYDNEDLKYLLRIAYLYHKGYKISRIASLTEDEICRLTLTIDSEKQAAQIFVNRLTEASLDFDQERFDEILSAAIADFELEEAVGHVVFPFLRKIGLLWLAGNVNPAQEHFASGLIIKKLHLAIQELERPVNTGGKKIILFTPKGEFHEIPVLFMHYLLKKNKTRSVYLGKNISIDELQYYCHHQPATHLYFHLITRPGRFEPDQYIKKLSALFPGKQIVVSGFQTTGESQSNLRFLKNEEEMFAFAKEK
ncbi:MAG TPA: MerR family transcriptional regulator [Puia sp.]|nr:MerR family transcriptional regulator [Puia sp.]